MQKLVTVWDKTVRLSHFSYPLLIAGLWLSNDMGEMEVHMLLGFLLITIVATRIIWGAIGSSSAKFSQFVKGPKAIIRYIKHQPYRLNHNPLGALMVLALLFAMLAQGVTGLFSSDEVLTEGPLVHLINYDLALTLTAIHKQLFWGLLALIGIHLLAVIVHQIKGDKIVQAMLHGKKELRNSQEIIDKKSSALALLIWIMVATPIFYYWARPIIEQL